MSGVVESSDGRRFAASYAEARECFLGACAAAGARVVSHAHPLAGPDGGPLFLDEARLGADDAPRVLFVASGTHGIEGFCGSAIQTRLLRDGAFARPPEGCAVVLVHAVNPWGFAWLRRVNEDNVDVNRNFLDHDAAHPENADYDALHDVLNPASVEPDVLARGWPALQEFEREHGWTAAYRAMSGGQYRHPRGIQYGGVRPVWSNRVLRDVWARNAGRARLAAFVDLHSGLGPCGVGLLFQTAPADGVAARLAAGWWPDVARSEPAAGTDAALVSGLIGPAFVAALPRAAAVGVVLEFGTRPMAEVGLAVQADNWLTWHGARDSLQGRDIERRMRDAFLIDDDEWKEKVCARAREVTDQALAGMAAFAAEAAR
ncbi:MAG: M14 family metallopeptidase [Thermodesulfobacteriota bacterium]